MFVLIIRDFARWLERPQSNRDWRPSGIIMSRKRGEARKKEDLRVICIQI